jgi:hypothetical protein
MVPENVPDNVRLAIVVVPVCDPLLESGFDEMAEAMLLYSVSISVPLMIFEGLPETRPSLTAKLVVLV